MDSKQKNIWIGIIIVILIAGAYYFGTTSKNSSNPDVVSVSKCMEDGKKFALDYKYAHSLGEKYQTGNQTWYDPQYHFDTKLDTCLVYVYFAVNIDAGSYQTIQSNKTIFDVYSNKAIIQSDMIKNYVSTNGKQQETDIVGTSPLENIPNLNEATFGDQSKALMSE